MPRSASIRQQAIGVGLDTQVAVGPAVARDRGAQRGDMEIVLHVDGEGIELPISAWPLAVGIRHAAADYSEPRRGKVIAQGFAHPGRLMESFHRCIDRALAPEKQSAPAGAVAHAGLGRTGLDLGALAPQREEPHATEPHGQQRQNSRLRYAASVPGVSWVLRFRLVVGRPGQRSCTSAHALEPHLENADAGRLHMTAAAAAMLAIPAILVILFIAAPSNDPSLAIAAGLHAVPGHQSCCRHILKSHSLHQPVAHADELGPRITNQSCRRVRDSTYPPLNVLHFTLCHSLTPCRRLATPTFVI